MTNDYRVKALSDSDVRAAAKRLREYFDVADERYVDVVKCLEQASIWTLQGEKRLRFSIDRSSAMGSDDGQTIFDDDTVTIRIREKIIQQAFYGEGRARNTCAHELGHAALWHDRGVPMARQTLEVATPAWIPPFKSAEHQAKVFAPQFLINDAVARSLSSAEDFATEFGISLQSARIHFGQVKKEFERATNAASMLQKAAEFRASFAPKTHEMQFLQELCTSCRQPKLFAVGSKYMCQNCNAVSDRFQDGDSVA